MAQILVRQLDASAIQRLKRHAQERRTSSEALARDAIHKLAAQPTVEEKQQLVREMQARTARMMPPGVVQTPGVELIRESRDRDR